MSNRSVSASSRAGAVVPWRELSGLNEPHYPSGQKGRPPIGMTRMLRIYFLQHGFNQHRFNLSDPQAQACLNDSEAIRKFVGTDFGALASPDEMTICIFRHLIEEKGMSNKIFESMNEHHKAHLIRIGKRTIVDATIITAPSSPKNKNKERDLEMP